MYKTPQNWRIPDAKAKKLNHVFYKTLDEYPIKFYNQKGVEIKNNKIPPKTKLNL
jgi:hypothetical protein